MPTSENCRLIYICVCVCVCVCVLIVRNELVYSARIEALFSVEASSRNYIQEPDPGKIICKYFHLCFEEEELLVIVQSIVYFLVSSASKNLVFKGMGGRRKRINAWVYQNQGGMCSSSKQVQVCRK